MTTKPPLRIGVVHLSSMGEDRFLFRYTDPVTQRDVRRRLSGLKLGEAKQIASHISQQALAETGYLPGSRNGLPPLEEGFEETIRLSQQRSQSRKDSAYQAARFVTWIRERHPSVRTWDQVRPAMVQEYARELERAGKAPDTVRLALAPVKATWRYLVENYPDRMIPLPKIRLAPRQKVEIECLDGAEVAQVLQWMEKQCPSLHGMAVLQSLAGFRVYEAAAVRRQDIDFCSRTVTVTKTEFHTPKTRSSYRTVPVCSEVLHALRLAIEGQKVVPSTGEIFLTSQGRPWTRSALGSRWKRALVKASEEMESPRLAKIPPKRLRSSFATMANRLGVSDRLVKCYLGHAPGDVLGEHYQVIGLAELGEVSSRFEDWRTLLAGAGIWQDPGNSQELTALRP